VSLELEYVRELGGRCDPIAPAHVALRRVTRGDVAALYDVYRDAFSTRTSELLDEAAWIEKWPLDPACALNLSAVALSGPTALGYLLVDLDESHPAQAAIAQLGVRVRHRRQGIGRALIARALDEFAREGFARAILRVAPDNAEAIRLYESLGFTASRSA
jgi:ribosomal protein S18 acetylase RimI-like enzyme